MRPSVVPRISVKSLQSLLVVMILLSTSCAGRRPGDPLRPGFNLFSVEQEVELGREAAAQIRQNVEVVNNQSLQNYIRTLGGRLAQTEAAGKYPYNFTLINDPSINAFALPGGPIFVHSGLIANAENEAQLVGVLAHEIAHVALRHGTNQASKANLVQLPAMIAGSMLGQGATGQLGQLGLALGLETLLMSYSRGAENEADALGSRIMAAAGYNPIEMARFFEKLESQGGSRAPQFLSSHPNPGNRVTAVQAEIQTFPTGQYGTNSGQFNQAKQLVSQLPPPRRNPQQTQRSAAPQPQQAPSMPQGGFQQLNARQFTMQYPTGWQAFGDQNSAAVTIAPREGLVQDSRGNVAIGYGSMLSYYFPQNRSNLQQATAQLVQQLQQSNPGMRVTSRARQIQVDGSQGLITQLQSNSPYGGTETNILVTVNRPEGVFYMVFVAPEQHFSQLQGTFETMLQSLRFRS
jgi:beta-barrel assembly-enhancing protease